MLLICDSIPTLGYIARRTPKKQEFDLVRVFIDRYISSARPSKDKTAIFLEPMVDTGYPDIVIVKYHNPADVTWQPSGTRLSKNHYKVLSAIDRQGKVSFSELASLLGYEERKLRTIVNRLNREGLIRTDGELIKRKKYAEYYCVTSIVTIEAKVSKWAEAIDQAILNTRFSTQSYILMHTDRCSETMRQRCDDFGIGIYISNKSQTKRLLTAKKSKNHNSYISFLFNELVLRIEKMEVDHVTE